MNKLKEVLEFLKALQENNHREWMEKNKTWYKEIRKDFEDVAETLFQNLCKIDKNLIGVKTKDCLFRINRDIRFSNDKSPYKNNFGAYFAKGGKNGASAGFYLHVQPHNESMIGGGKYMPVAEELKAIRQEIDYNADRFLTIINEKNFKAKFGEVKGDKLKKAPKGYLPDNPAIEWLKLKSFFVLRTFNDTELSADHFMEEAVQDYKMIKPFNDFMNEAISAEQS